MPLRDYQTQALDEIRAHYGQRVRRVLLHLATGGGKTATFCDVLKGCYAKGTPAIVAVRGRKLIQQASDRLTREDVPHGIIMAGQDRGIHDLIRVCSIDTLYARKYAPPAKMIIIDEAHQTGGEGYKWFLEQYPEARILAVTATPHLKRGMRHVADVVVYPISAAELTKRGFLVPLRYFSIEVPDLTGVSTTGDDYNQKELGSAMGKMALYGHEPTAYLKHLAGQPVLCFAVNIEHSLVLVDQFAQHDVKAEHIDASASDGERVAAISRLERGEIQVLCNVGIMTTGVDITFLRGIIMSRPTKSYNLWIQMIGRGTRPHPGKGSCIILDHAGNTLKHGFLETERECILDGVPKGMGSLPIKQCGKCGCSVAINIEICPECGTPFPPPKGREQDEEAELVEITEETIITAELTALIDIAKRRNYKKGWIRHRIEARFGKEAANELWEKKIMRLKNWHDPEKPTGLSHAMAGEEPQDPRPIPPW